MAATQIYATVALRRIAELDVELEVGKAARGHQVRTAATGVGEHAVPHRPVIRGRPLRGPSGEVATVEQGIGRRPTGHLRTTHDWRAHGREAVDAPVRILER